MLYKYNPADRLFATSAKIIVSYSALYLDPRHGPLVPVSIDHFQLVLSKQTSYSINGLFWYLPARFFVFYACPEVCDSARGAVAWVATLRQSTSSYPRHWFGFHLDFVIFPHQGPSKMKTCTISCPRFTLFTSTSSRTSWSLCAVEVE